jgi:hypothetical protein
MENILSEPNTYKERILMVSRPMGFAGNGRAFLLKRGLLKRTASGCL